MSLRSTSLKRNLPSCISTFVETFCLINDLSRQISTYFVELPVVLHQCPKRCGRVSNVVKLMLCQLQEGAVASAEAGQSHESAEETETGEATEGVR